MPKKTRTPEEQAALSATAAFWMQAAEDERRARAEATAAFATPRHTRKEVAAALRAREVTFQNWLARDQISLDANDVRQGAKWRLYSPRDVLRLGLAVKLSDLGFPASLLRVVLEQLDPLFSAPGPYMVSNRPSYILVLADGEVIGPELGNQINLLACSAGHFIVVRLDTLVRDSLEPLGYSITHGDASAMKETAERLRRGDV